MRNRRNIMKMIVEEEKNEKVFTGILLYVTNEQDKQRCSPSTLTKKINI